MANALVCGLVWGKGDGVYLPASLGVVALASLFALISAIVGAAVAVRYLPRRRRASRVIFLAILSFVVNGLVGIVAGTLVVEYT
jgi:hypothetical protein